MKQSNRVVFYTEGAAAYHLTIKIQFFFLNSILPSCYFQSFSGYLQQAKCISALLAIHSDLFGAIFLIIHSGDMFCSSFFTLKEKLWEVSLWIHLVSLVALQTFSDEDLERQSKQELKLQGLPWPAVKLLLNTWICSYLFEESGFSPLVCFTV